MRLSAKRQRIDVRPGGSQGSSVGGERLVYENFNGAVALDFGANRLISDDISTTAPDGCRLRRFEFEVDGRVDPQLPGGPYTVNYALYRQCPFATTSGPPRDALRIPGTIGFVQLSNEDPMVVSVMVTDPAAVLPPRFWLGLSFSRSNAGAIIGAASTTGHSADLFDFPGSACQGNVGGFPNQPHGSFNIRVFASEDCPAAHVGYQSTRESGSSINSGSTLVPILEDVELGVSSCRMVSLGIGVRAPGTYAVDLRRACDEEPIPGTSQSFLIGQSSGQEPRVRWLTFDPPVELPKRLWFAGKVNNLNAGFIVTSAQPSFGSTEDFFTIGNEQICEPADLRIGLDALHLSIVCEGDAPLGACCDAYQPRCKGGVNEERRCETGADCGPEGICEARCAERPLINCSFRPANTLFPLNPPWQEGESCESELFQSPCGLWACCTPDGGCENLTKTECEALEPAGAPRQWQMGKYCDYLDQECPIQACVLNQEFCELTHAEPGCRDRSCCNAVCSLDPWCCDVEWDRLCIRWFEERCSISVQNDVCTGAFPIEPGQSLLMLSNRMTSIDVHDPPMCCHNGLPGACVGGDNHYETCLEDADCQSNSHPEAHCATRDPVAFGSGWYKFTATETSAKVTVCGEAEDASDAIFQILSPAASGSPAAECGSLDFVACAEDGADCGPDLPSMCVTDLVPGETYYVLAGAKSPETKGRFYVTLESPCPTSGRLELETSCPELPFIAQGPLPLAWQRENLQCPPEDCLPGAGREMWVRHVPDCTGSIILRNQLCGAGDRPELMIAVYEGCDVCPGEEASTPLACKPDLNCPSYLTVLAVAGHCYTIRLGQELGAWQTGTLDLSCFAANWPSCDPAPVFIHEPKSGTVDARQQVSETGTPLGIDRLTVHVEPETKADCWALCESQTDEQPNYIREFVADGLPGDANFSFLLAQPIRVGAVTTLQYLGESLGEDHGEYTSHPGNVNGDALADADDVMQLVDVLEGQLEAVWGKYSVDCDHSGVVNALDLVCVIDLLNSGWNGTPLPKADGICP